MSDVTDDTRDKQTYDNDTAEKNGNVGSQENRTDADGNKKQGDQDEAGQEKTETE